MHYQYLLLSSLLSSLISFQAFSLAQSKNFNIYGYSKKISLTQQFNPQIVRAYVDICAGHERRNLDQVTAYDAPSYRHIDANGKITNSQQIIQKTSAFFQNTLNIKCHSKIESITYDGQLATVSGIYYVSGFARTINSSYSGEAKFQDTWIHDRNKWKMTIERELSTNVTWIAPN
jgi:hypothetical protein